MTRSARQRRRSRRPQLHTSSPQKINRLNSNSNKLYKNKIQNHFKTQRSQIIPYIRSQKQLMSISIKPKSPIPTISTIRPRRFLSSKNIYRSQGQLIADKYLRSHAASLTSSMNSQSTISQSAIAKETFLSLHLDWQKSL